MHDWIFISDGAAKMKTNKSGNILAKAVRGIPHREYIYYE